jgi:hypothetical protein
LSAILRTSLQNEGCLYGWAGPAAALALAGAFAAAVLDDFVEAALACGLLRFFVPLRAELRFFTVCTSSAPPTV